VRSVGLSHDGELLAYATGDSTLEIVRPGLQSLPLSLLRVKQASTSTGESVHTITNRSGTAASERLGTVNTLAWHPSKHYLAYAGDEQVALAGAVHVFGL
jgi:hypothetical protein